MLPAGNLLVVKMVKPILPVPEMDTAPIFRPPAKKLTLPERFGPADEPTTVAVKFTLSPSSDGFALAEREVVVEIMERVSDVELRKELNADVKFGKLRKQEKVGRKTKENELRTGELTDCYAIWTI